MNLNQPTTYADLDGGNAESLDSMEMMDSADSLSAAYADLGKAFYEYRFEEPTPELLLYFDRITELLKTNKDLKRQRNDHIEPMTQTTDEPSSFTAHTNPNFSQEQSSKMTSSNLEVNQQITQKNSNNEREFDPQNQNSSNHFNTSSWEEPEDLESSFLNPTYNQSSLEQQQTFVAQPQLQQSFQAQGEKKKKGGFSPFRKKEKDRVSSFDELPDMENGRSKFSTQPETPQVKYCPVCHNPVGYGDDFCGNCGTRLSH